MTLIEHVCEDDVFVYTGVVYLLKFLALELKAVFQIDVADF